MALRKIVNDFEFLCVLTGEIDINVEPKHTARIERELSNAFTLLDFLRKDMELCIASGILLVQPKFVNVLGVSVEIKENFVNSAPYFGFAHTKAAIQTRSGKDAEFDATDLIPDILAHNLYSLITKSPYNEEKAEDFTQVVLDMNFIEAMQIGNFFLLQQKNLWVSRRRLWRIRLMLWRSKLVSKFLVNTALPTYWKHYREEIFLNGKV